MLAKRAQVNEEELIKDDEVMCTCLPTASIGVRPVFLIASSVFPTRLPHCLSNDSVHSK
jgi:hypothetical protein